MQALRRRDLVGVLAWVLSVGAVLGLVDATLVTTSPSPRPDQWAALALTAVLAAACWRTHLDPPRWLGDVALGWFTLLLLASIAETPEPGAAGFLHLLLVWLGVLAFGFLPRRRAWVHTVAATAGALAIWTVDAARPVDMAFAAVFLLGTLAGVGMLVSLLVTEARVHAHTDELTGIANRRGILADLADAAEVTARDGRPLSLLVLDLDGFKEVNDRLGHAAGDELLLRTTASWHLALRGRDRIGRLGGDEFLVVLPDADDAGATLAEERLQGLTPREVSVSIGRATLRPGEAVVDAMRRADAAMYDHKHAREPMARPVPRPAR